jgi:hypothetical protein
MTGIFGAEAMCPICFEPWSIARRYFEKIIAQMEAVLNTGTLPKAPKERGSPCCV